MTPTNPLYLTQTHKLISSLTLIHLIFLLFTPHALTPTPPSLACISTLCSALYSVVSFFLFFFFLSSSSSTRFWSFFFFFKFYFCLIWSEKYVLKVEICYQNTKQHWSATKNHQVPTNSEAFIFIIIFFFTECGKKIFRSCMLLFSSASALFDLFSRNPEID